MDSSLPTKRTSLGQELEVARPEFDSALGPIRAKLRIGLDGRFLSEPKPTGIHRYLLELCKQLDWLLPQAQFFLYSPHQIELAPFLSPRWMARLDPRAPSGPFAQTRWLRFRLGAFCRQDSLDVFWATGVIAPLLSSPTKLVTLVYDLTHIECPQTMPLRVLLTTRLFFKSSIKRASAIVAISHGTARRVSNLFHLDTAAVVRPAVSEIFSPRPPKEVAECLQELNLAPPYLLAVASQQPRKNLELLVRTFVKMKDSGALPHHKLVLAGAPGWKSCALRRLLTSVDSATIFSIGYVPEKFLPCLYSGADVFVYPSSYEGFGMPVAEARVCGARVVASDTPELREAGDEHVLYVTPTEEELGKGILGALSMPRPPAMTATQAGSWRASGRVLANLFVRLCETG
jgi:glycosyltransferase involved in cell wall biosynthesis